MDKSSLIDYIVAKVPGIGTDEAQRILVSLTNVIVNELAQGHTVPVEGLGTFSATTPAMVDVAKIATEVSNDASREAHVEKGPFFQAETTFVDGLN